MNINKLLGLFLLLTFWATVPVLAQDPHSQALEKAKPELKERAIKAARKEAKKLAKDGWYVVPGSLAMDKQLEISQLWNLLAAQQPERYIVVPIQVTAGNKAAAKNNALAQARVELAGLIEAQVKALVETTVGNEQINQEDAASINKALTASKALIANKLSARPCFEAYRDIKNNNSVEISIQLGYDATLVMKQAKEAIKEELRKDGKDLHEELDRVPFPSDK
jgi:hypothetical protein